MRSTARLFIIGILFLPPVLLISARLAHWLMWILLLLFVTMIANSIRLNRRDVPVRKARIEAILAARPDYVVYGSGTPKWLAAPIYVLFGASALALIAYQAIFGPPLLHGFSGFLTAMMYHWAIPIAILAATGTFKWMAWHLRKMFPDRVLLFANGQGIGTSDGFVMPYARIRRIDPCSWRSKFGTDNWIEIDDGTAHQVHLNMVQEPIDDILTKLRDCAKAHGAPLLPAYPNGKPTTAGTTLGYRMTGYGENPWRAA